MTRRPRRDTPRRLWHEHALSTRAWDTPPSRLTEDIDTNVTLECGWGRLVFGQTFDHHAELAEALRGEEPGRRDICLYVREPQVLTAYAPQELFIDPSVTFRLWMHHYRSTADPIRGVLIRKLRNREDAEAVNRVYTRCGMVTAPSDLMWENQLTKTFTYLVAEDADTGQVIGTVTGVDHHRAFNDPERGTSLWCLAVDPQADRPGVGQALVRALAERYKAREAAYLDLSVMHDNEPAIKLYEKLGFVRVPVFCVKRKNPINERLFAGSSADVDALNPYARIIADEAMRRGIAVDVVDAEGGYLKLSHGGREIVTRESLSELTTSVAMSRCDDKRVTRRLLQGAGLRVAEGREATFDAEDEAFLAQVERVVVKPARGEQGNGVTVDVKTPEELHEAVRKAAESCPDVLIEEHVHGDDLRIVVIGHEVVAAAVRRPASVRGDGRHTIEELIASQSRRRAAATDGESQILVDETTLTNIAKAGYQLTDVLPRDEVLRVRGTANLHTGGTIHDVTADLHPSLAAVAIEASRALDIPVVGLDLMVPAVDGEEYAIIEANERPGLANHEPQPTAERFIDLLFPSTRALPRGWEPDAAEGNPATHHP